MNIKVIIATASLTYSLATLANTCPTQLTQEHDGYWASYQQPGWRSTQKTDHKTKLSAQNFGGAIYAPKEKRLACIYRSSKGYWVALISRIHKGIQLDRHALDEAHHVAWRWDAKMHDFACSKPYVNSTKECRFVIHSKHA